MKQESKVEAKAPDPVDVPSRFSNRAKVDASHDVNQNAVALFQVHLLHAGHILLLKLLEI